MSWTDIQGSTILTIFLKAILIILKLTHFGGEQADKCHAGTEGDSDRHGSDT